MTFGNYAKYWVGRPRPDYFDRCFNYITKETDPDSENYLKNKNVDINDIKATGNVLENFYTVGADSEVKSFECYKHDEESRAKILTEGLKSFPSGHSLSAAVVFWFCSLYSWLSIGSCLTSLCENISNGKYFLKNFQQPGPVSSVVERWTFNPTVVGSTPTSGAVFFYLPWDIF